MVGYFVALWWDLYSVETIGPAGGDRECGGPAAGVVRRACDSS